MITFIIITFLLIGTYAYPPSYNYPQWGPPCQQIHDNPCQYPHMYQSADPPCAQRINVIVQPEDQKPPSVPPPKPPPSAPEPKKPPPASKPSPNSRMFTNLFSLPGMLADNLLSGEINLLAV